MLEAIQDWIGGIALAITTAVGAFLLRLSYGQQQQAEQIAVLKHQAAEVPKLLGEIRDEVKAMREDGSRRQERIFEHIDKVRLELKADIVSASK